MDDFGCICEIRRTYIDTHISHTGHFAHPRTPPSCPTSGGPAAQAPRDGQARQTCQQLRHDPQVWTPQNLRHGNLRPGLHLRLCALRQATPQALLATQAWKPQVWPPPQALRRVSELAKPPQALLATQVWKPQAWPPPQTLRGHSRPHTTPQALCAEMANCSASRSGCSRKRHIPSACCSISPGQGHQAE